MSVCRLTPIAATVKLLFGEMPPDPLHHVEFDLEKVMSRIRWVMFRREEDEARYSLGLAVSQYVVQAEGYAGTYLN